MPDPLQITRADTGDIDLLCHLGRTTFLETYGSASSADLMEQYLSENYQPDNLIKEFEEPSCHFFIAQWEGHPAGFAKIRQVEMPPELAGRNHIELQRIYVLNAFHGKKIGKSLLEHCKNKALELGFDMLWLGVWTKNLKAIEFYMRNGFTKAGHHVFHFGEEAHLDDLLITKLRP